MAQACLVVTGILVAAIGYVTKDLIQSMEYSKELTFSDTCELMDLATPAEDITALGDGHCAIAGGGDIWSTFSHGSASSHPGAFWLVNATSGTLKELEVVADHQIPKLIPHGLYLSQITRRLYAINHDEFWGESVEVFDLVESPSMHLEHIASITSPLFGNGALDDVVEGLDGEFFVTEFRPFPLPVGGKRKENLSFVENMHRLGVTLLTVLKIPTTRVFRCTIEDGCSVATSARFVGANGIAVTKNRMTYFVNDPPTKTIKVFGRQDNGELLELQSFKTKHALDNIEMDHEDRLNGGTLPLLYTCGTVCEDAPFLAKTQMVGGREVTCGQSPGGLLLIGLLGTGGLSFVDGNQMDILTHDGSLMSDVSSAVKINDDYVLMGSPLSKGVLRCALPQDPFY